MKQYLDLLQNIIDNGVEKESGRANMPNTIGISHAVIQMDLQDGFPLLTTKKMYWKGIIHELLWFLRGSTNIKYLVDNNVNIWNDDSYKWYLKYHTDCKITSEPYSKDEFISIIKSNSVDSSILTNNCFVSLNKKVNYKLGDLGKVYGYQWRNQNGVDQIAEVLDGLKTNPYSRYHIIDAWNKADFKDMALPPCHLLYQFIVRPLNINERNELHSPYSDRKSNSYTIAELDYIDTPKFYLDLNMYQRSCDSACGIPFNLASMSLLLMLFAKVNNMIPGVSTWIGGDTHLYLNHIENIKEQISREPFKLPKIKINKDLNSLDDILRLSIDDFELIEYNSHPTIKFELFTGLKK